MKVDQVREFCLSTLLDSFGYFCEKTVVHYKPYGAVRMKDEPVHILKNRMEETGSALLKTAPVAVDKVVANSWTEKYPRALNTDSIWQFSLGLLWASPTYLHSSDTFRNDDY